MLLLSAADNQKHLTSQWHRQLLLFFYAQVLNDTILVCVTLDGKRKAQTTSLYNFNGKHH